jgi:protocatechuate 3,4-dioxygenase, beta subunit
MHIITSKTELNRRKFFRQAGAAGALFTVTGLFAEELIRTPRQTEGPYYPDQLPLDRDNDLVKVSDSVTPALGEITHLHGTIKDTSGKPLPKALIEIWQVDNYGSYLHSQGGNYQANNKKDTNFQGYGRFETDAQGRYRFRTIKPVPYPGRTPHIHVKISDSNSELLTTQCYVNGHEMNRGDGVLRGISDPLARETVMLDWNPVKDSTIIEFSARFDVVIGLTPSDPPARR